MEPIFVIPSSLLLPTLRGIRPRLFGFCRVTSFLRSMACKRPRASTTMSSSNITNSPLQTRSLSDNGRSDAGMAGKAFPFVPTADLYDEFLEQARVPTGVQWKSFGGRDQFAGVAFTIKCFDDNSRLKEMANTKAPSNNNGGNHILMVDAGGPAARCAVMGDLVARDAKKNGWGGVVIYGNVRDTAILKTIKDFGIVALGSTPQKSIRRGEGQVQIPIQIGGVMVRPGDRVYVDSDGVLILDPNATTSKL